ncbi:component of SufBCD complex [Roseovarius sp. C7]|uniref:component of SufBCD complex n=1 Tax=Roseovarius sp. C7 TaxID=3398643 RepID=UPI0039F60E35
MKTIVAIRTNRWTSEEERLLASLQASDVAVVFHNRPEGVAPPVRVVDVNDEICAGMGLGLPQDWGWRCGDYFYYALRAACPEYDHYWLVEPDVFFAGDASGFFAAFEGDDRDVLAIDPKPFEDRSHPFLTSLQHLEPYRAIFALTRFSGRALDRLLPLRRENGQRAGIKRRFANDEFFAFSNAWADETLSVGNLVETVPDWFEGGYFDTDPDLLIDALRDDPATQGKVFHPVKSKEHWVGSVAKRLANKTGFLGKMGPSLAKLSDAEIEVLADQARANLLAAIKTARNAGGASERK